MGVMGVSCGVTASGMWLVKGAEVGVDGVAAFVVSVIVERVVVEGLGEIGIEYSDAKSSGADLDELCVTGTGVEVCGMSGLAELLVAKSWFCSFFCSSCICSS